MKIVCPVAGLGGEYGAFTYIVPVEDEKIRMNISGDLQGKICLLTGSTGGLGLEIAKSLAKRGAEIILHYHSNKEKIDELISEIRKYPVSIHAVQADFSNNEEVKGLIESVKENFNKIDYVIHSAAITGGLSKASEVSLETMQDVLQVNQFSAVEITIELMDITKDTVLYIGSVAEDAQFSGSSSYIQAKKGLHGFAVSISDELRRNGIRSIYYMPGTVEGGMSEQLTKAQTDAAKLASNQFTDVSSEEIAERIVKSLYKLKVLQVSDSYEKELLVRRDTYKWND